jgi:membrane-associated phospholipid phosphatase
MDRARPLAAAVGGVERRRTLRTVAPFVALAAALLVLTAVAAQRDVTPAEIAVFRALNQLPDDAYVAIWPFMQYGTFLTIPVLALVAFAFRRVRLAVVMLLAGVGVYLLAKVVKGVVGRERPAELLTGVRAREEFATGSLGFPSGHAAVAAALTFVVWRHLGRRWGVAATAIAVAVLIGRAYVGAHLPLDLIGGAALGCVAAEIANVLVPPPASAAADAAAGERGDASASRDTSRDI